MITLNIDKEDAQNAYYMMELEFFSHLKNLLEINELGNCRAYVASLLQVMDELEKAAKGASDNGT